MTDERTFEARLEATFDYLVADAPVDDDPDMLASGAIGAAHGPRLSPSLMRVAWLAAALIVLLAAALAFGLLAGAERTTPLDPALVASPIPTVIPMAAVGLDGSPMANGRYRTVFFQPGFEFAIATDRWVSSQDLPRQWLLRGLRSTATGPGNDALSIVHVENLYVDPCTKGTDGGTQPWTGDAAAFIDWLRTTLPVSPEAPRNTRLFGRPAIELDLVQAELSQCTLGYLPITDVGRTYSTGRPGQPTRYTAVDVDGQTLLVAAWATDPAGWPEVRAAADEVLGTIQFD